MAEEKSWDEITRGHVNRVAFLCGVFCRELCKRAEVHDTSKFSIDEAPAFKAHTHKLKGQTYLSGEYKKSIKDDLGKALKHHYSHNRHHPEFWKVGMSGMSLIDLVEMMLDWIAASERHADGDPFASVIKNTGRFSIPPMLSSILSNTVAEIRSAEDEQEDDSRRIGETDQVHHFWEGWGSVDQGAGGDGGVREGGGEASEEGGSLGPRKDPVG